MMIAEKHLSVVHVLPPREDPLKKKGKHSGGRGENRATFWAVPGTAVVKRKRSKKFNVNFGGGEEGGGETGRKKKSKAPATPPPRKERKRREKQFTVNFENGWKRRDSLSGGEGES